MPTALITTNRISEKQRLADEEALRVALYIAECRNQAACVLQKWTRHCLFARVLALKFELRAHQLAQSKFNR
jgi:hypothetical protein